MHGDLIITKFHTHEFQPIQETCVLSGIVSRSTLLTKRQLEGNSLERRPSTMTQYPNTVIA